MDLASSILRDNNIDTLLRNLSVSTKKWPELVAEISETAISTGLSSLRSSVIEEACNILKLNVKSNLVSQDDFDEGESRRITDFLKERLKNASISVTNTKVQDVNKILEILFSQLAREGDDDLSASIFQSSFCLKLIGRCGVNNNRSGKQTPVQKPITSDEIVAFMKMALEEDTLHSCLLMLLLFIYYLDNPNVLPKDFSYKKIISMIGDISRCGVYSTSDVKLISTALKQREVLKLVEGCVGLYVIKGQPTNIGRFEISGKTAAIPIGYSVDRNSFTSISQLHYYEVFMRNKGEDLSGIKLGWIRKNATIKESFEAGATIDTWVLDFGTNCFLHDCKHIESLNKNKKFNLELSISPASAGIEGTFLADMFPQDSLEQSGESQTACITEKGENMTTKDESVDSKAVNPMEIKGCVPFDEIREDLSSGCVFGCLLDSETGIMSFFANNKFLGNSAQCSIDRAEVEIQDVCPLFCCGEQASLDINIGNAPFKIIDTVTEFLQNQSGGVYSEASKARDFGPSFIKIQKDRLVNKDYLSFGHTGEGEECRSCIIVSNVSNEPLKSFTVEMSVRLHETIRNSDGLILSHFALTVPSVKPSIDDNSCTLGALSNGSLFLEIGGFDRVVTKDSVLQPNIWAHVSVSLSYHKSTSNIAIAFFLNGSLLHQTEISVSKTGKSGKVFFNNVSFGGPLYCDPAHSWIGDICNIRIWNIAKTADKLVPLLSRSKLCGHEKDLLLFIPCLEGSGNIVHDLCSSKSQSRIFEKIDIHGNYIWKKIDNSSSERIHEDFTSSVENLDSVADSHMLFEGAGGSIGAIVKLFATTLTKLQKGTSKVLSSLSNDGRSISGAMRKLYDEFNTCKHLISSPPGGALFGLINALICRLLRTISSGTGADSDIPLKEYALIVLMDVIHVNLVYLESHTTAPSSNQKTVSSRLFGTVLYLLNGCSFLSPATSSTLRSKALNSLKNHFSRFIPTQLYRYQIIVLLIESFKEESMDKSGHGSRRPAPKHLSASSLNLQDYLNLDPFNSLLVLDVETRETLLASILEDTSTFSQLQELVPASMRPTVCDRSRDAWIQSQCKNKTPQQVTNPIIGSVVKRGPDWRYGNEDGGSSSLGILLSVENWQQYHQCGAIVAWCNGGIGKYRCGVPKVENADVDQYIFDIETFCDSASAVHSLKKIDSETSSAASPKKSQDFHLVQVIRSLLNEEKEKPTSKGNNTISKRSILVFLKEHAPYDWQVEKGISKSINSLSNHTNLEVCSLFAEYHIKFSGRAETSTVSFRSSSDSERVLANDNLLSRFVESLFTRIQYSQIHGLPVNSLITIIAAVEFLLLGRCEASEILNNSNTVLDDRYSSKTFMPSFKIQDKLYDMNWGALSWSKSSTSSSSSPETVAKAPQSNSKSSAPYNTGNNATIIRNFPIEAITNSYSALIRPRSRCVDISISGEREWNTIICDCPMPSDSGVYVWYVKLRFHERRSQFVIGVCTGAFGEEYIGHDRESWGITNNLEFYHGGRRKKLIDRSRLSSGTILEITLDSNSGKLSFNAISSDEVLQLNYTGDDMISGLQGELLFPAFSLYNPGDVFSLVTDPSEIAGYRSLIASKVSSPSVDSKLEPILDYIGSPNLGTVDFVLKLLSFARESFSSITEKKIPLSCLSSWISLVIHSLGAMYKWGEIPMQESQSLSDSLSNLLENILTLLRHIQSTRADPQSQDDSSLVGLINDLEMGLFHLLFLNISLIGKIASAWMHASLYYSSLNELITISESSIDKEKEVIHRLSNKPIFQNGLASKEIDLDGFIDDNKYSFDLALKWYSIMYAKNIRARQYITRVDDVFSRLIFALTIYHGGFLNSFIHLMGNLQKDPNLEETISNKPLPKIISVCWENAVNFRNAHDLTKRDNLTQKIKLIARFESYMKEDSVLFGTTALELIALLSEKQPDEDLKLKECFSSIRECLLEDFTVSNFEVNIANIQKISATRCDAFNLLHSTLVRIAESSCTMKAILIDSVSDALKGRGLIWKYHSQKVLPSSTTLSQQRIVSVFSSWHYSQNIVCISEVFRRQLRASFSELFSLLVSELLSSNEDKGIYLISLLNAMAIQIDPCDHELLSRCRFFTTLEELLDLSELQNADNYSSMEEDSLKTVYSISMKLFILMGLQVAASPTEEKDRHAFSYALEKSKSGPATLNKSVFELVFRLLNGVLEDLLANREDVKNVVAAGKLNNSVVVLESTALLLSASTNDECRRLLTRSKWIILLLSLAFFGVDKYRARAILILIELLPRMPMDTQDLPKLQELLNHIGIAGDCVDLSYFESVVYSLFFLVGQTIIRKDRLSDLSTSQSSHKYRYADALSSTLGVVTEGIALIRTLYMSENWRDTVDNVACKCLTYSHPNFSVISSRLLGTLGVLGTLGGYISAPYNSGLVLEDNNEDVLKLGILVQFHDSQDKADVIGISIDNSIDSTHAKSSNMEVKSFTFNGQSLKACCRYPLSNLIISKNLFKSFLTLLETFPFALNSSSSASSRLDEESKQEKTLQESKEEISDASSTWVLEYTKFSILKASHSLFSSTCISAENMLSILAESDLPSVLSSLVGCGIRIGKVKEIISIKSMEVDLMGQLYLESKKAVEQHADNAGKDSSVPKKDSNNNDISSVKKVEIPPLPTRRNALSKPLLERNDSRDDSNEDLVMDEFESLVNMGFPRDICALALQLCRGDPEEALNYILTNGPNIESPRVSPEGHEGDTGITEEIMMDEEEDEEHEGGSDSHRDSTAENAYHYCGTEKKVLPFYYEPSIDSERLGCLFPGDDISPVSERKIDEVTWYQLQFSNYDNNNYSLAYGSEINELMVWVPSHFDGRQVILEGMYTGNEEDCSEELEIRPEDCFAIDCYYRITGSNGALVRDGLETSSSSEITTIDTGDIVHAYREGFNLEGTVRLQIDRPLNGWISKLFGLVQKVSREEGEAKLQQHARIIRAPSLSKKSLAEYTSTSTSNLGDLGIEDNLEAICGSDTFSKDDRFFSGMQGSRYSFIESGNSLPSGIQRDLLRGASSTFSSNNQNLSQLISDILCHLGTLSARGAVLSLCYRAYNLFSSSTGSNNALSLFESFLMKLNPLSSFTAKIGKSLADIFEQFIRLLLFRGNPNICYGNEYLLLPNISMFSLNSNAVISAEEAMITVVSSIVKSKDAERFPISKSVLSDLLISLIKQNIKASCDSQYNDRAWAEVGYWQETDEESLKKPKLHLALWATVALGDVSTAANILDVMSIWVQSLRCASLSLKNFSLKACSYLLTKFSQHFNEISPSDMLDRSFLQVSIRRLFRFAAKRLWQEMEDAPAFSRFMQSFVSLLFELKNVTSALAPTGYSLMRCQSDITSITSKLAIHMNHADSHVILSPQKDLSPPWTLEALVYRKKIVPGQCDPILKASPDVPSTGLLRSRSGQANTKPSLSTLLKQMMGEVTNDASVSTKSLDSNAATVRKDMILNASHLLQSSRGFIKLQKGGRTFIGQEIDDPLQALESVHDEALCMSVGQSGSEEKVLDCVVPYDRWVNVTVVCDVNPGYIAVYIDGVIQDSVSGTMSLPIAILGSNKPGLSFSGEVGELKVFTSAKSTSQVAKDFSEGSARSVNKPLIHMRCTAARNESLYDLGGFISHCRLQNCSVDVRTESDDDSTNIEDQKSVADQESSAPSSSTSSSSLNLYAMESSDNMLDFTGILRIAAVPRTLLSNGIEEIVLLSYKVVQSSSSVSSGDDTIDGYLEWCERGLRFAFVGRISAEKCICFRIDHSSLVSGPPEKLPWFNSLSFTGKVDQDKIIGECFLDAKIEVSHSFPTGTGKANTASLPAEVLVVSPAKMELTSQESVSLKKDIEDGQYVVFYEIAPYISNAFRTFGMVHGQGNLWLEWVVNSNSSGSIGFGWSDSTALIHPDASVDANDGTWTYSTSGHASHGADLYLCEAAEEGDVISTQVNTSNGGFIRFYRNHQLLVSFDDINSHASLSEGTCTENAEKQGIIPFVSLVSSDDKVTLLPKREGLMQITFLETDIHLRSKFYGYLCKGSFLGMGLLSYSTSSTFWFGSWDNDEQTGLHLEIADIKSRPIEVVGTKFFIMGKEEGAPEGYAPESQAIADMIEAFYKFKDECIKSGFAIFDSDNVTSTADSAATVSTSGGLELQAQRRMTSITFVDHPGREHFSTSIDRSIPLRVACEQFATRCDASPQTFNFKFQDKNLDVETSAEVNDLPDIAEINTSVKSYQYVESMGDDPTELLFSESAAKYILQIIYEPGATVRVGVEIDDAYSHLRIINFGEVVEGFLKTFTSEGIGRFKIGDGWISEKLRGGNEAPVVLIFREKFDSHAKYKVIRSDGIKIRAKASLRSDERGILPQNTIVAISEKRLVRVEGESDWTARLHIESPVEYQGWISEKSSLVERLVEQERGVDQLVLAEKSRRNKIRSLRKSKLALESAKLKPTQLLRVKAELSVSQETFFLLKRSRFTDAISFSKDMATISYGDSSGGRQLVLGSKGFTHGVHYWEVQVKSASWGSVFIGVAPEDSNGWNGMGFINYRATQAFGSETLYGSYFGVNDKIGVLLDMDRGLLSFFKDGEDFNVGRVNVINLGIAYHNVRKSCGRQSSSPTLFPCFGMKSPQDQLSIEGSQWISYKGQNAAKSLQRILDAFSFIKSWKDSYNSATAVAAGNFADAHILRDIYLDYIQKCSPNEYFTECRPGLPIRIDTSQSALNELLGVAFVESHGIRVGRHLSCSYGEASLLGVSGSRVWYSCEKNGKKAWYWLGNTFKAMLETGLIGLIDEEPTSPIYQVKRGEDDVIDPSLRLNCFEDFSEIFESRKWSYEEDRQLTGAINRLAHKLDHDSLALSASSVDKYLEKSNILMNRTKQEIHVRYAGLCMLSRAAGIVLPLTDISNADSKKALISTDIKAFDHSINRLSIDSSTRLLILALKDVIFTSTKLVFWQNALTETIVPTAAPPDEYERPDEIREITINRIQARHALTNKGSLSFEDKFKASVFGQLMDSFGSWDDRMFRRSYIHMQDAGQQRAFFVKFLGEGVDDQGGPYRAIFQTALGEEASQLLDLISPCANAAAELGENRDKFVFNLNFQNPRRKQILVHLGKLIGIACRHKIQVPFPLAPMLWKALSMGELKEDDLYAIDSTLVSSLQCIEQQEDAAEMPADDLSALLLQALTDAVRKAGFQNLLTAEVAARIVNQAVVNKFLQPSEAGSGAGPGVDGDMPLPGSLCIPSTVTVSDVLQLVRHYHLVAQNECLQFFFKGLSAVLPVELMSIFSGEELETVFCGAATIDIDVLRKATVYESISPDDIHVGFFWKALAAMSNEQLSQFINFCSGRSRLPAVASDFTMPFKLTAPPPAAETNPDKYLPIARTCFFSLSLPKYTTFEACLAKLLYAIGNTELMDADFIDRRGTSGWNNI